MLIVFCFEKQDLERLGQCLENCVIISFWKLTIHNSWNNVHLCRFDVLWNIKIFISGEWNIFISLLCLYLICTWHWDETMLRFAMNRIKRTHRIIMYNENTTIPTIFYVVSITVSQEWNRIFHVSMFCFTSAGLHFPINILKRETLLSSKMRSETKQLKWTLFQELCEYHVVLLSGKTS